MGKKILYAAYGSNINLEQMAYRCPNSTVAGAAMLKGYELQFRYHATVAPNAESEVPILLWELEALDERFLDRYEGFPKYYRKEGITLELNGESVEAMVYIMNGDRPLESPTAEYYGRCEYAVSWLLCEDNVFEKDSEGEKRREYYSLRWISD